MIWVLYHYESRQSLRPTVRKLIQMYVGLMSASFLLYRIDKKERQGDKREMEERQSTREMKHNKQQSAQMGKKSM